MKTKKFDKQAPEDAIKSFEQDCNKIIYDSVKDVQISASVDIDCLLKLIGRLLDDCAKVSVERIYDKYGTDLIYLGWIFGTQDHAIRAISHHIKTKMGKIIIEMVKEELVRSYEQAQRHEDKKDYWVI